MDLLNIFGTFPFRPVCIFKPMFVTKHWDEARKPGEILIFPGNITRCAWTYINWVDASSVGFTDLVPQGRLP